MAVEAVAVLCTESFLLSSGRTQITSEATCLLEADSSTARVRITRGPVPTLWACDRCHTAQTRAEIPLMSQSDHYTT